MIERWTDEVPPSNGDAENNAETRDPAPSRSVNTAYFLPSIGVRTANKNCVA
jgi:hypothetical protein